VIIKFCLVFPKIFLLHKVVRDAKKVEKHWSREYVPLPDSTLRMYTIVGDLQCIIKILASSHARNFYGSRRATKVTTVAEAYDAVGNNIKM